MLKRLAIHFRVIVGQSELKPKSTELERNAANPLTDAPGPPSDY